MQSNQSGNKANLILVGFMGTGKTSVGKELATKLRMTFLDMDDIITDRAGKPISRIFAENGEPYFRTIERDLVKELSGKNNLVIATGGGIVLNNDNIKDFNLTGLVICLYATPETILTRVASDTSRPLLAGNDKMGKIMKLLESRRHLYESITHKIDTSDMTINEVVSTALKIYKTISK